MSDLLSKRRKLARMRITTDCMTRRILPPLLSAALLTAGIAAVTTGIFIGVGKEWAILIGLMAFFFVYCYIPLPKSWAERLDDELTDYDPVDVNAYAELHETTQQIGGLQLEAVLHWMEKEQAAIADMMKK
ncbi:hypothetical protein G0R39_004491 [Salmonella enterica]|nr:hypothetical protein [Salmonella enterica]